MPRGDWPKDGYGNPKAGMYIRGQFIADAHQPKTSPPGHHYWGTLVNYPGVRCVKCKELQETASGFCSGPVIATAEEWIYRPPKNEKEERERDWRLKQ